MGRNFSSGVFCGICLSIIALSTWALAFDVLGTLEARRNCQAHKQATPIAQTRVISKASELDVLTPLRKYVEDGNSKK